MNVTQLSKNGYVLTDIFDTNILNRIDELVDTFTPTQIQSDVTARREAYFLFKDQEFSDELRKILEFELDSNNIVTCDIVGLELWRDYPGYINPMHTDDPQLTSVLIIYLGNNLPNGTEYIEDGKRYYSEYKRNTGLVLLNSNKISHGMISKVPDNAIRKTLYINWR